MKSMSRILRETLLLCSLMNIGTSSDFIGADASSRLLQGCANGGVLLNGTSSCLCQNHWTGYDCTLPLCINGGTLIDNRCFCSSVFEGLHCEHGDHNGWL
ncbi:hypothetical protein PENTCL1PPCAC_21457, partial [Pristionchus entomophagus]